MSVTDRVWIGLRADGIELMRVEASCREVSRSNGVATFQTFGAVLMADIPVDIDDGALTVHDAPDSPPLAVADLPWHVPYRAGTNLTFDPVDFVVALDVPKYVAPERKPKPKRQRLRLTR